MIKKQIKKTEKIIDFKKLKDFFGRGKKENKIIPVVVQDWRSRQILILAYVNEEALLESLRQQKAIFWSTSRNELWIKGSTSGNFLMLKEVLVNCENNSLLYLVEPKDSGVCHTKNKKGEYRDSCFYRSIELNDEKLVLGSE